MKKISEMTMAELSACLCKMAPAADRLFSDGAVCEAFDEMKARMNEKTTVQDAVSMFTGIMFPVLMGEKHKQDCYDILHALGSGDGKENEGRNGIEVLHELFTVFVIDGDVQSMFRPCTEIRGK